MSHHSPAASRVSRSSRISRQSHSPTLSRRSRRLESEAPTVSTATSKQLSRDLPPALVKLLKLIPREQWPKHNDPDIVLKTFASDRLYLDDWKKLRNYLEFDMRQQAIAELESQQRDDTQLDNMFDDEEDAGLFLDESPVRRSTVSKVHPLADGIHFPNYNDNPLLTPSVSPRSRINKTPPRQNPLRRLSGSNPEHSVRSPSNDGQSPHRSLSRLIRRTPRRRISFGNPTVHTLPRRSTTGLGGVYGGISRGSITRPRSVSRVLFPQSSGTNVPSAGRPSGDMSQHVRDQMTRILEHGVTTIPPNPDYARYLTGFSRDGLATGDHQHGVNARTNTNSGDNFPPGVHFSPNIAQGYISDGATAGDNVFDRQIRALSLPVVSNSSFLPIVSTSDSNPFVPAVHDDTDDFPSFMPGLDQDSGLATATTTTTTAAPTTAPAPTSVLAPALAPTMTLAHGPTISTAPVSAIVESETSAFIRFFGYLSRRIPYTLPENFSGSSLQAFEHIMQQVDEARVRRAPLIGPAPPPPETSTVTLVDSTTGAERIVIHDASVQQDVAAAKRFCGGDIPVSGTLRSGAARQGVDQLQFK